MTNEKTNKILNNANRELSKSVEKPMTVQQFMDEIFKNKDICRTSHQYLLDAIEHFGKRQVFENGEEKERYIFFDDPANNGENAVLGNTDELNSFVTDLRVIVNSEERMQKIILFSGPTATGKSELKRCLINGLKEYSKTESGKKYTIEWNISSLNSPQEGLSYSSDNNVNVDESEWFTSPIQSSPLSVFPRKSRKEIEQKLGKSIPSDVGLDPFSQEAYDIIKKHYEKQNTNNLFTNITNENHFRIRRYLLDETKGIGILTAEDDGSVKERLIGGWMPSMFQVLDSRGRKNPQAFSYDGVLSQGNNGLTIVEDATKHIDILTHLLNIPDEGHAKIDKKIGFDVDTVPIFISNPDLIQKIQSQAKSEDRLSKIHSVDPLKAIKRRILQYNINYLTSVEDETTLIRKEITGNTDRQHNIRDSISVNDIEFAPHVIEAVALYTIVTRLDDRPNKELSLVDIALLLDRGYLETEDGRKSIDEFDVELRDKDGTFGMPVTYTRDVLRAILYRENEKEDNVYLPDDVLNTLVQGLSTAPIFSDVEQEYFEERVLDVKDYIFEQQEKDVIKSILSNRQATDKAISKYINNLYAWEDNDMEECDELVLKEFEKTYLGTTDSHYQKNSKPSVEVEEMRQTRIIKPLNQYLWKQRDEDFEVDDVSLREAPVISSILETYDWEDVFHEHENLKPMNWKNPPDNTPTEDVKQKCINNMVDELGYTRESAIKTSNFVLENKENSLERIKNNTI